MNLKEQIAKNTVELYVAKGKTYKPENIPDELKEIKSCFVTITKDSELRGCIGTIEPRDLLYKEIIQNAISAATRDWRFPPVKEKELPLLEYEVSVLTPPQKYEYKDTSDLLNIIKNKGVIVTQGFNKGVYLPQVWEHFNNAEDFLSSLCSKAGLNKDEWKFGKIVIELFEKE